MPILLKVSRNEDFNKVLAFHFRDYYEYEVETQ
jgi:hypothetical protein